MVIHDAFQTSALVAQNFMTSTAGIQQKKCSISYQVSLAYLFHPTSLPKMTRLYIYTNIAILLHSYRLSIFRVLHEKNARNKIRYRLPWLTMFWSLVIWFANKLYSLYLFIYVKPDEKTSTNIQGFYISIPKHVHWLWNISFIHAWSPQNKSPT